MGKFRNFILGLLCAVSLVANYSPVTAQAVAVPEMAAVTSTPKPPNCKSQENKVRQAELRVASAIRTRENTADRLDRQYSTNATILSNYQLRIENALQNYNSAVATADANLKAARNSSLGALTNLDFLSRQLANARRIGDSRKARALATYNSIKNGYPSIVLKTDRYIAAIQRTLVRNEAMVLKNQAALAAAIAALAACQSGASIV